MRRAIAFLLVVLFGAGPLLPALALDRSQNDLPACCRKNGAHMCSLRTAKKLAAERSGKPRVRGLCPFLSHAVPGVKGPQSFAAPSIDLNSAIALQAAGLLAPADASAVTVFFPGNPKRGPPSQSSL